MAIHPYLIVLFLTLPIQATAQDRVLGLFDDWGAYQTETGDMCWIATTPRSSTTVLGDGTAAPDRTGAYLMFRYVPGAESPFELSYAFGRNFPQGTAIELATPLGEIAMFEENGWAWVEQDDQMDLALSGLQQAEILDRDVEIASKAHAFSARDAFSAKGLDVAMRTIIQSCSRQLSGFPQRGLENWHF